MGLVENVTGRLPVGGEFQGYNGDCVEYAIMVGRCASSPQYPCDRPELNRLTSESISAGQAGSAGQMTDANAAWLCTREGIPFQQLPFNLDSMYYWLSIQHAVVQGFSNGQALPGNEPNVFGHAVTFLAHGANGFTIANGDSVNGRAGQLDTGVLTSQVLAAQPTTMTVIHPVAPPAPTPPPIDVAGIKQDAWDIQARMKEVQADATATSVLAADILKKVGG